MSNLTTLPKGDSAWLFRKAIERIIQQISDLETNIGSSTTGNSANTQIIFNDNGVLRGDPDLTFNTALNKLVATALESTTSLVVGTSATITGDLTVKTNVLKVDTTNNRVGVNTASPATDLEVRANGNAEGTIRLYSAIDGSTASPKGSYFSFRSGTVGGGTETARLSSLNRLANVLGGDFSISTADTSNVLQNRLTIDSGGVFTFAVGGSTAMTLNSTGLGVGVVPNQKFCVLVADSDQAASFRAASGRLRIRPYVNAAYGCAIQATNVAENALQLLTLEGVSINLNTNSGTAMTLDSSGNVGISIGNLVISTSGKGIDFSATPNSSGTMTSELLNDYEEGTFVPTVRGGGTPGTTTYTTQIGRYTKVGRLVTVSVSLAWTNVVGGTGGLQFGGLPFVSANTAGSYDGISIAYVSNIASTAGTVLYGLVEFGSTVVTMTQTPTGGGTYGLVALDTAGEIAFTATYTV